MKRLLIDAAHSEEVRVVIADGNRIEDFEVETAGKAQLKGNIYIGHVSRVEPSLQAAFITYGGNRNGFLAFGEVHPQFFNLKKAEKTELLEELTQAALRRRGRDDANDNDIDTATPADDTIAELAANPESDSATTITPEENTAEENAADADPEDIAALAKAAALAEEMDTHGAMSENAGVSPVRGGRKRPLRNEGRGRPRRAEATDDDKPRQASIHRRYRIQDVLKEGQKILVQVVKEERGSKGAALTTYFSLPGRYTVLMPNTPAAGGISRKVTDGDERRTLREAYASMDIPATMGLIIRTAGVGQPADAIKRDYDNLRSLWSHITDSFEQEEDIQCLHEDGSLVIHALRDMMSDDIDEIIISGKRALKMAKDYTANLMPEAAKLIREHKEDTPLFTDYKVESKLANLHHTRVQLPSGGYMIINPTEALVAVDINSGRATQERNIEETALKTNLEAAEELARHIRLRDLAGLIVVDFIDMESGSNNRKVENAMRKALRKDRARVQCGHLSDFGLMEISRQRLRPSFGENLFVTCPHCNGSGMVHAPANAGLMILRRLEDDDCRDSDRIIISTGTEQVLWLLNHKRELIRELESKWKYQLIFRADDTLIAPDHKLELIRYKSDGTESSQTLSVILREQPELPPELRMQQRGRNGNGRKESDDSDRRPARDERRADPRDDTRRSKYDDKFKDRTEADTQPAEAAKKPQRSSKRPQRLGQDDATQLDPQALAAEVAADIKADATSADKGRGKNRRRKAEDEQPSAVEAALFEPIPGGKPNHAMHRGRPQPVPLPAEETAENAPQPVAAKVQKAPKAPKAPAPRPQPQDEPLKVEKLVVSNDDTPVIQPGPRKTFAIRKQADTDAVDTPLAVEKLTEDSVKAAKPARKPAPKAAKEANPEAKAEAKPEAASAQTADAADTIKKGSILARLIGLNN